MVIAEHFKLHQRDQREGKAVAQAVAELRKLAEHCDFKACLHGPGNEARTTYIASFPIATGNAVKYSNAFPVMVLVVQTHTMK